MQSDAFNMMGYYSQGKIKDLGICTGQTDIYKTLLEDAKAFTQDHSGGKMIDTGMVELIKTLIDNQEFYDAIMGAYDLGFERGYKMALEDAAKSIHS